MNGVTPNHVGVIAVVAMTVGILGVFLYDDVVISSVGVMLTIAGLMGVMFAVRYTWEDPDPAVERDM